MPAVESFRCRCGAWVLPGQVLERGVIAVGQTPTFLYLRYRCEVCQRIREKLIAHPEQTTGWSEPAEPLPLSAALRPDPWQREEVSGPIDREEIDCFTSALGRVTAADFAQLRRDCHC